MITCNDHPVLKLALALVRVGNWVLDVEVDAEEAWSGDAVLRDEQGNAFHGTVYRAGFHVGRVHARIMGGAGGLSTVALAARHYQSVSARLVAEDAISEAGETIDPTSDPLTTNLDFWTRAAPKGSTLTAGLALSQLCDEIGALWRVLPNGNVWVGLDGTDPVVLPEAIELDRDRARGTVQLGLDALLLLPGEIFNGERISRIQYSQSDSQHLRATYWPEAA
jgi:hypothetical protein